MTQIRIDYNPKTLQVSVPLQIIMPNQGWNDGSESDIQKLPVLYLLHGLSDDSSAWQRYTNLEILAWDLGFIAVLPTGGRSMYANMDNGQAYFDYITSELPEYLDKTFKFDLSRQNCLIAGNSMGGLGAFKSAFLRPELYRAAFSLSGALIPEIKNVPEEKGADPKMMHEIGLIYGGLDKVKGSGDDPMAWLANAASNPEVLPALYSCCGTSDDLLTVNRIFQKVCEARKIPLTYWEEKGGKHNWYFWQKHIEKWLRMVLPERS